MDKPYHKRTRTTWSGPESWNTHWFTQTALKKISNSKTPGHDGIHFFLFKKFTSIHNRQTSIRNEQMPSNSTRTRVHDKGRTTLIQKDPNKGTAPNNYRPITCLQMMWKILTAQIRKEIYYTVTSRRLLPDE